MNLALKTPREVAEYIVKQIAKGEFFDTDFVIAEIEEGWDLDEIRMNSTGWHGLKRIDTGFDDWYSITVVADYYGGGSFRCFQIGEDEPDSVVIEKIENEIIECLRYSEYYDDGMMLLVEFLEKEDA